MQLCRGHQILSAAGKAGSEGPREGKLPHLLHARKMLCHKHAVRKRASGIQVGAGWGQEGAKSGQAGAKSAGFSAGFEKNLEKVTEVEGQDRPASTPQEAEGPEVR
eukprot:7408765-Karenia_brevis.AAC.1